MCTDLEALGLHSPVMFPSFCRSGQPIAQSNVSQISEREGAAFHNLVLGSTWVQEYYCLAKNDFLTIMEKPCFQMVWYKLILNLSLTFSSYLSPTNIEISYHALNTYLNVGRGVVMPRLSDSYFLIPTKYTVYLVEYVLRLYFRCIAVQ